MIAKRIIPILVLIGIAVAIGATSGLGQSVEGKELTGSWLMTVNQVGEEPFMAVATFTQTGEFAGEAQGHSACCPHSTGAYGVWESRGENSFVGKWVSILFNADLSLHSILTVNFTINLDDSGNGFSGEFEGAAVDSNGRELFTLQGTHEGERIQIGVSS